MRSTPKIIFQLDQSVESGAEILNTLNKIEKERENSSGELDTTDQES